MRFGVLGSLEVVRDGDALDLGRPKQRAVLAVLLLDANRVVSLDRLIDLLWGDEPPARSTASLQAYVSNLRRILEPARSRRAPADVLVTEPPGYLLRVEPAALDATRFEAQVAEGTGLLAQARAAEALVALDAALALWRGPVLADFEYQDFARHAAVRWDELREVAREARIDALLALGGHARAAAELEGMVADGPLRERRWGQLMLALYRDGRQAEALRAAARARSLLAEELGVDPGPELARLEADILAHAPDLEWSRPAPASIVPAPAEPPSRPARRPLIGRGRQLDALTAALDDVRAGHGRTVVVSGEAGIGKSRLLEELADVARAGGALVAWGRAVEGGGAPAFWPWAQVLRAVTAAADPSVLAAAAGPGAAALAPLVPALAPDGGPPPFPVDVETARFQLYEAVAAILRATGDARPVVVLLDDLHWADAASLAVTEFVAGQPAPGRLLLVVAVRREEVRSDDRLAAALAALARAPGLVRVELAGLPPAAVADFVTDAAGAPAPAEVVEVLRARTEGNPFYLGELVRLLVAERSLDSAGAGRAAPVPVGVGDVIRRRLARLPEATNALLRLAAVVGREFDLTLLAAAADLDEEAALVAVEAALLVGVVVEDAGVVGRYRFAHELVRETLSEQLSALRRARFHGDVGRALERRAAGDDHLAELAHHFAEAAPVEGPEPALTYVVRASEAARARLALEDAQSQLRRALELVRMLPAGPERATREIEVQLLLAGAASLERGFADAEAGRAWDRVAELCREFGHARQLLSALSGQWIFAIMRGDAPTAQAVCDRVVDFGQATGDLASVMVGDFHSGYMAFHRGDLGQARTQLERAVEEADEPDQDELVEMFHLHPKALFLGVLAMVLWLLDDEDGARAREAEALGLAESSGHPFTLAVALVNSCMVAANRLDVPGLLAQSAVALAATAPFGLRSDEAHVHAMRGWAVARSGDPAAGVAESEAALAEIAATGRVMSRSLLLGLLADANRVAGRLDDALAALEQGLEVTAASGERFWEADLYRLRGELLFERAPADREEALACLRRAVEVATRQGAIALRRRAEDSLARLVAPAH